MRTRALQRASEQVRSRANNSKAIAKRAKVRAEQAANKAATGREQNEHERRMSSARARTQQRKARPRSFCKAQQPTKRSTKYIVKRRSRAPQTHNARTRKHAHTYARTLAHHNNNNKRKFLRQRVKLLGCQGARIDASRHAWHCRRQIHAHPIDVKRTEAR